MRNFSPCLLALLLVSALPPAAHADYPHEPAQGGVLVTSLPGDSQSPSIISDGAGGSIVAWNDYRGIPANSYDIYAQRLDANGRPLWGANGRAVCTAGGSQNLPRCAPDGAGGVVIVWRDERVSGSAEGYYAQRLNAAGVAQWTADGVQTFKQPIVNYSYQVAPDGSGGAYFTALRDTVVLNHLFVQRVSGTGTLPWGLNGIQVQTQSGLSSEGCLTSDGAGGAIVGWAGYVQGVDCAEMFAQRYNSAGTAQWQAGGARITFFGINVTQPQACTDGGGGAYLAFVYSGEVHVVRIEAGGSLPWGFSAPPVSSLASTQISPRIAPDGSGGALVLWSQGGFDLWAQRVSAVGSMMWSASGAPVSGATSVPGFGRIAPDGLGGLLATWEDVSAGANAVFAQRLNATGVKVWGSSGIAFPNVNNAFRPAIASDGSGSALLTWDGAFSGFDVFAQTVDRYGFVGNNAPAISAVRDVAADQGGRVKVSWSASWRDNDPAYGIEQYRVWRSVATSALSARALFARGITTSSDEAADSGALLADAFGATDNAWELAGTQPASLLASYSLVASTGGDSTASGLARTAFRIEALASSALSAARWMSSPDSGYSVDNLPPAAPAPFTGNYAAGVTQMTWQPNSESDLAGYRLYRGASAAFVPGPGNLIATPGSPLYNDAAGFPYVYKLTAVDTHGNESAIATLIPAGTLEATAAAPRALTFAVPSPNPARGATLLRFALPAPGRVTLALFDAGGRRVRTVRDAMLQAGDYAEPIELRDDAGRALAPGLYLAHLESSGRTISRRIVAVR